MVALLLLACLQPAFVAAQGDALPELISAAAYRAGVHPDLLSSIVWLESQAWPWALNVNGVSLYPRTRTEAERVLGRVGDDVDIGYAQISYRHWGRALGLRKAELLDPRTNLIVGALILRDGMNQEAGWGGVGRYHSATPHRKLPYANRVAEALRMIELSRRPAVRGTGTHTVDVGRRCTDGLRGHTSAAIRRGHVLWRRPRQKEQPWTSPGVVPFQVPTFLMARSAVSGRPLSFRLGLERAGQ